MQDNTARQQDRPRYTIGLGGSGRAQLIQLNKHESPSAARRSLGLVAPRIRTDS